VAVARAKGFDRKRSIDEWRSDDASMIEENSRTFAQKAFAQPAPACPPPREF
jgi:hypothetical protein